VKDVTKSEHEWRCRYNK